MTEPKLSYANETEDTPPVNTVTAVEQLTAEPKAEIITDVPGYIEGWKAAKETIQNAPKIKLMLKVPFIGRLVYIITEVSETGENQDNYAQVIRVVEPGNPHSNLDLFVITQDKQTLIVEGVPYGNEPGQWHWPMFVPDVEAT
jgi:hypothetical protein